MISVILALVVAQLFLGLATLTQTRSKVRPALAHATWVFCIFMLTFQHWWSLWDVREIEWNFPTFLYNLIAPSLLFFAATLVSPREVREDPFDLEEHFQHVRRPLMAVLLIALLVASLDGPLFGTESSWNRLRLQQVLLAVAMAVVLFARSGRVHRVASLLAGLVLVAGLSIRFLPGVIS